MTWRAASEARRRLERETGTIQKDWGGRLPVALIRPTSYYLGMSSLGLQTIYGLLNSYEHIVCERVFWDPGRSGADDILSIESQRPVADFDVLAFSMSYELDYPPVVRFLKACRIPLDVADREESHPLVIGGGPCVTANPLPLSPFFDVLAIGEGEPILPALADLISSGVEGRRWKLLKELGRVPGLYLPLMHDGSPVRRQWLRYLDSTVTATVVTTPDTEFGDTNVIEIARGCPWGCRFCLAGYCMRPFRRRSPESILDQVREGLRHTARVGLLAAAVSDHPDIEELVREMRSLGAELSVSSLRAGPVSRTVMRELALSGAHSIALAPETGSERLRSVINKDVSEDDIIESVTTAAGSGFKQVKLYFMVGLPTETDDDVREIVHLTSRLKERVDGTGCRLALTVAPFVPKANTPFQWLPMETAKVLDHRVRLVKRGLAGGGVEVRSDSVGWSMVQGALSRGDAALGMALSDVKGSSLADWRGALAGRGLTTEDYARREYHPEQTLPWSFIDTGVSDGYLRRDFERSQTGEEGRPCDPEDCTECGVCE